jgi:hypothetical protein
MSDQPGEVIYTPPEGEHLLRGLLKDWERFLHESRDLDPLVRIGVLEEIPVGREKLFLHSKLMRLLSFDGDAFAPCPQSIQESN